MTNSVIKICDLVHYMLVQEGGIQIVTNFHYYFFSLFMVGGGVLKGNCAKFIIFSVFVFFLAGFPK